MSLGSTYYKLGKITFYRGHSIYQYYNDNLPAPYTCGGQMSRGRAHTLLRRPTPGPGIHLLSLRAPCSLKIAPKQPIIIYLLGPLVAKYETDNGVPCDLAENPIPPSFVQIQYSNLLSKGSSSDLQTHMTLPATAVCYSRKRTTSLCLVVEKGSSSKA